MPTYEYRCPHCGHEFELFQKITGPPRARCPKCRRTARRVISGGAGLLFKGAGFYATDYRTPGYKEAEKKEKGEPGGKPSAPEKRRGSKAEAGEGKS
ncbi:MAG: zinc ribbon domain-containing protein [Gemmatimonadetes bacterium]|nr:zinc ribbon domain-containing protein [Gemmatimonadota bacterium]